MLLKYRGAVDTTKMLSSKFLYFISRLQKDINDRTLDPYPQKEVRMIGQGPLG
ncbi:hypothetical protein EVB87_127 [Rhizobium phage RHph_N28_1]|nr:hypothetical protein EVB87_127 [Rhizobium phage RHph_N28_1]QIG74156.1 hypothetical protein EVC07_128 [Rhizobium phage RHph_N42]QIG74762.1 hypothetical protein EVC12_127 [Rhizobium phage RHph_I42]QXV73814.1 hypothetical protein [Rhizobium phage RHph_N46]